MATPWPRGPGLFFLSLLLLIQSGGGPWLPVVKDLAALPQALSPARSSGATSPRCASCSAAQRRAPERWPPVTAGDADGAAVVPLAGARVRPWVSAPPSSGRTVVLELSFPFSFGNGFRAAYAAAVAYALAGLLAGTACGQVAHAVPSRSFTGVLSWRSKMDGAQVRLAALSFAKFRFSFFV